MTEILHDHAIDTVIHFAGLKAVGESVAKPLEYYDNNVNGTLRLVSPCARRASKPDFQLLRHRLWRPAANPLR